MMCADTGLFLASLAVAFVAALVLGVCIGVDVERERMKQ